MRYSPTDFYSTLMPEGPPTPRSPQHRFTVCPVTGDKLLDAHALWDLLQGHELFKRGQLDIADVVERLKGMAQCDGQGPAFKEGHVRQAIAESAALGRDELI
jgi:AP-1-like factor